MSNYSKTTDFAAKDSLPSGDAAKIIRGSEFETEFDNISIAIATKADSASPTFTGTVTIDGLTVNGNTTLGNAATDTVTVTADIASNLIPSADNTHDLGASGAEWKDLYVDGVAYIDTVAGFATTENITFGDGDKAIFGASSDLQIYHSGTASHITENGSGSLFIDGTNLRLRSSAEEIYLEALSDGAVTLYYNNAAKLATTSLGIDITGTAEVDALSINGTTVTSTATELNLLDGITGILDEDNMASNSATALATQQSIKAYVDTQVATADALSEVLGNGNTTGGTDIAVGTGDDITFADNSKAIFGAGSDLQIYHDSANSLIEDSGTGNLLIRGSSNVDIQPSGGGSYMARFTASGAASLYHSGSSKLATTSTGIDVTGTLTADEVDLSIKAVIGGATPRIELFENDTIDLNTRIRNTNGTFQIQSTDDAGTTSKIRISVDHATGDFSLYNEAGGAKKLVWDASAERLGIGNTSPTTALDVTGTVTADDINLSATGALESVGTIFIDVDKDNSSTTAAIKLTADGQARNIGRFVENGDVSFYEDTGTTAKLFWDASAESLGIGTSSPSRSLHINSGTVNVVAKFESSDSIAAVEFVDSDTTTNPNMGAVGDDLRFVTNNAEAMRIDSSGLVGIGTDSPSHKLDVNGNAQISAATGSGTLNLVSSENVLNAGQKIAFFGANRSTANEENAYIKSLMTSNSGGAGNVQLGHLTFGTSGSERVRIDSDGNVGIGTDSPSSNLHVREGSTSNLPTINIATKGVLESTAAATAFCGLSIISGATSGASILNFGDSDDEDVGRLLYAHSDNSLRINTSASEAMRITSDGNLLVAKTAASTTNTVGHELDSDGHAEHITDGVAALMLNRKSTDGVLIEFRKDNATVGSIGANSGNLYIGNGDTTIVFSATGDAIVPRGSEGVARDAAIDLGNSSNRFKDLYLSGGAYLGGTAAANKLDDYEEGTFTPTLSTGVTSPTYTNQNGSYKKVGDVVYFQIRFKLASGTANNSQFAIGGLPFNSSNTSDYGGAFISYSSCFLDSLGTYTIHIGPNANALYFYDPNGSSKTGNEIEAAGSVLGLVYINGFYKV